MQRSLSIPLILLTLLLPACSKEKKSDKAGEKMQDFVVAISDYARGIDSDFIVIPQNGPELAFNNLDINDGLHSSYVLAIDGIGLEELFYSGGFSLDVERLAFAQELGKTKTIMVSEFVSSNANVVDAIQRNIEEGFLSFLRVGTNYDYLQIPDSVNAETANSISSLSDAANFLYLISTDNYTSKQLMINAIAATNYDVVLIDLFFDGVAFSAPEIQQLKTKANGGKRLVIAYMNIGAAESFRYYWKDNWKQHKPKWLKKKYEGFEDEIWVKFWKKEWQDIIYGNDNSYSKKILDAGFDGVHLDNVEAYYFLYFD